MAYLVVIGGAPGSGKTTITKRLHQHFQSVMIEIGWLRQYHLDSAWLKASPHEEAMSFENLVFIIRNYFKHDTITFFSMTSKTIAYKRYQRCSNHINF